MNGQKYDASDIRCHNQVMSHVHRLLCLQKADLLSRFILMGEDTEAQNFTNKTLRDIILNFIIAGLHSPSTN